MADDESTRRRLVNAAPSPHTNIRWCLSKVSLPKRDSLQKYCADISQSISGGGQASLRRKSLMKLFSALGLVILIVALKVLMSDVVSGFETTLLQFFEFARDVLAFSQASLHTISFR